MLRLEYVASSPSGMNAERPPMRYDTAALSSDGELILTTTVLSLASRDYTNLAIDNVVLDSIANQFEVQDCEAGRILPSSKSVRLRGDQNLEWRGSSFGAAP